MTNLTSCNGRKKSPEDARKVLLKQNRADVMRQWKICTVKKDDIGMGGKNTNVREKKTCKTQFDWTNTALIIVGNRENTKVKFYAKKTKMNKQQFRDPPALNEPQFSLLVISLGFTNGEFLEQLPLPSVENGQVESTHSEGEDKRTFPVFQMNGRIQYQCPHWNTQKGDVRIRNA